MLFFYLLSNSHPSTQHSNNPPPSEMVIKITDKQSKRLETQSKQPPCIFLLFIILYFCYRLKRRVLYFFGLGSILLAWGLLLGSDAKESKWINLVTSSLSTGVIGTGIWILKVVILKVLACLYDKKFLDKIQDLISQQDVLQTLLGVPAKGNDTAQLKWITEACVNGKGFFILCDALNKTLDDDDEDETLTNQDIVVSQILKNLKKNELGRETHEVDLLQVMKEEDVPNVFKLSEGAVETKVIDEASLKNWMVKVLNERKTLVHPLRDTITELNTIMSWIVLFLASIIWLCFMGFATDRVLVFIGTLVVFFFGPSWNNISGGIIFIFLQHPFDIGDCCVVDNERSSEMRDTLEILIDGSTSNKYIADLKLKKNEYIGSNPKNFKHDLHIQEIEDAKYYLRHEFPKL